MADFDFAYEPGMTERASGTVGVQSSFTAPNAFLRLPEEMHIQIMALLPVPDMLVHSRTCKLLYLLLSASLPLQLLIALHSHALAPLPTRLTPAQSLARLHVHATAWATHPLAPRKVRTVRMPPGVWLGWKADLRDGWVAECDEGRVALRRLPGRWDGFGDEGEEDEDEEDDDDPGDMRLVRPPGGRAEGSIEDVLLDPSQDLLVYITRTPDRSSLTLHLLTLSLLPHPLAFSPTLTYLQTWTGDFPGVKLFSSALSPSPARARAHIALVVLSFLGRARVDELVLFNWRTGAQRRMRTDGRHYESAVFVDGGRAVVAPCLMGTQPMLDVYAVADDDGDGDGADCAGGDAPRSSAGIRHTHSLLLPRLAPDIRLTLTLSPNRSPSPSPTYPQAYPWTTPAHLQLLLLTLRPSRVTSRIVESGLYALFLLAHTLFPSPAALAAAGPHGGVQVPELPWAAWGPQGTRIVLLDHTLMPSPHGVAFTHGTRAVVPAPAPDGAARFTVVDFNPYALRLAGAATADTDRPPSTTSTTSTTAVLTPSTLPPNPFFASTTPIQTALPYRATPTPDLAPGVVWAWVDEARVVLVRRAGVGTDGRGQRMVRNALEVLLV